MRRIKAPPADKEAYPPRGGRLLTGTLGCGGIDNFPDAVPQVKPVEGVSHREVPSKKEQPPVWLKDLQKPETANRNAEDHE